MDGTNGLSASDVALLGKNGNGWNDASILWFVILIFAMGGFGAWGGRGAAPAPQYATTDQLTEGLNNNRVQDQLQQIALSSANNNYETAQLISAQTNSLMQQNYANQINVVQGFNQVNTNMMAQTNSLNSKLDALASKMDQCCCSIKTQMLQDKYEAAQRELTVAQNAISNYNQSQYILGQMGRYVAWAGQGSSAGAADAAAVKLGA